MTSEEGGVGRFEVGVVLQVGQWGPERNRLSRWRTRVRAVRAVRDGGLIQVELWTSPTTVEAIEVCAPVLELLRAGGR
jgi:hypothetical protein